jgi:S1-C subfamily serine protease
MARTTALLVLALPLLAASAAGAEDKADKDVRRSVVQVFATQRVPSVLKPWQKQSPREVAGSGVVIEGRRILTNAHLVLYASQVYVQPYQGSDRHAARVVRVAPGIDLALLQLEDDAFFKGRPPVRRAAELPEVRDTLSVYGYPIGGSSLAVTRGTVARIDFGPYAYAELGLHIQVDAALNPGNSGGPALVKDQMVGLVIGSAAEGQNIGYLIPNEEIDAFLKDGGKPKPRIRDELQTLQNEALRKRWKVGRDTRGVLVRAPHSPAASYALRKGDIITRVGSYDLDNDGMVRIKDNLRLAFHYVVPKLARDGRVPVTVLREGKARALDLPVPAATRPLVRPLMGKHPPYFVWGPLVFSPATLSLAMLLEGHVQDGSPLLTRRNDEVAFDGEELVVVVAMLPHRLSKGYGDPVGQVVREVNGTRIRNLRHLVEMLRDAKGPFVEFEFCEKYVETLVFDRKEVLAAMDDILSDNNIGKQWSDNDLRKAWLPEK